MKQYPSPFPVLDESIETLFLQYGLELTQEQRSWYISELSALAQEKLGMMMMEKLTPAQTTEFQKMIDNKETNNEQWKKFWETAVPDYEEITELALSSFKQRMDGLLQRTV